MSRMAALLRGINVGGHKRVPMVRLRALLESVGCTDVVTHLQSGNVVFSSKRGAESAREIITRAITSEFGFEVDVFVRTAAELQGVIDANPFAQVASDPSRCLVLFLDEAPEARELANASSRDFTPERLHVRGREVYLWCANGVRDSALLKAMGKLSAKGTARNWSTVTRVAALAGPV